MKNLSTPPFPIFYFIIACSGDSEEEQDNIPEFDRSTILKINENIIIPRYNDFKTDLMHKNRLMIL